MRPCHLTVFTAPMARAAAVDFDASVVGEASVCMLLPSDGCAASTRGARALCRMGTLSKST